MVLASFHTSPTVRLPQLLTILSFLAGCSAGEDHQRDSGPPPEAGYVVIKQGTVPLYVELAGRTAYALSLLVVFLCLAALYESWSIPFAVAMRSPRMVRGSQLISPQRCGSSASSTHTGAWSLAFSHPRTLESTWASTSLSASCGLRSRWSMRRPASRP